MDDILASIRRILDDGETAPAAVTPPAGDVFVLDTTMLIEDPAPMPDATSDSAEPEPEAVPHDYSHLDAGALAEEPLLAASTAAAASAAMGALGRKSETRHASVYRGGPTLEDLVRDALRPLVKAWLDDNLPEMVERLVAAEIARVSR